MAKKKTKIIKELELHEVEGYSQARIEHYLSLGYRPYLDEKSKVKWLTPAQRSMRSMLNTRVPLSHRLFPSKNHEKRRRRKRSHPFIRFLRVHLFFVLMVVVVLAFVALLYFYPNIFF